MKVYIDSRLDPWVGWHIQLQKTDKHHIFTPNISEADTLLVDLKAPTKPLGKPETNGWFFANDEIDIKDHEATLIGMNDWNLLVTTNRLKRWCSENIDIDTDRIFVWEPPSRYNRVPANEPWNNKDFMVVSNGSKYRDNLAEVVKGFLEFSMVGEDSMVEGKNNLKIFSAQECPIEPFNNIQFWGMQPNTILYQELVKSKIVICPYGGLGIPSIVEEARNHGVLCLTKANQSGDMIYTPENLAVILDEVFRYEETVYKDVSPYNCSDMRELVNGTNFEQYEELLELLKNGFYQ